MEISENQIVGDHPHKPEVGLDKVFKRVLCEGPLAVAIGI